MTMSIQGYALRLLTSYGPWVTSGCTALAIFSQSAVAQTFPTKPLRIIVTAVAGSAPDVRARQIAPKLSESLGQTVIVENRPGANGRIAAQQAAQEIGRAHV